MRIYKYYRVRPPVENEGIVRQQLSLGHTYHKVLVLVERDRRVAVEALYRAAAPGAYAAFVSASEAVVRASEAVRVSRSTGGDVLEPDDDMKKERRETFKALVAALEVSREGEKVARQAWYDARKAATAALKDALRACDTEAYARTKFAYNRAGSADEARGAILLLAGCVEQEVEMLPLAWGTRLRIAQFVELAAKASMKEGFWLTGDLADAREARRSLQGSLPRVPRFDGGGTIAVQLQGGLDPAVALRDDAYGPKPQADTQITIDPVDPGTWQMKQGASAFTTTKKDGRVVDLPQPKEGSKRSQRHAESGLAIARLRVGSDGRTPIWAAWPVDVHRPLPAGAPIKWAEMHARKIGPRTEWSLLVTVDDETPRLRPAGETLAVNLGWRNLPDTNGEIRVAYAVGSDGHEEEVRVPVAFARGMDHVESLTAIRKRLFNDAVKFLNEWVDEGECPAILLEAARYRDRWLAPKSLVRFLGVWKRNRFDGDTRSWAVLAAWEKKDKHLWFWESDERVKLLRMRNDLYRRVAARWARDYAHVLVTDMDLRDFAEGPAPEEGADSKGRVQRVTQKTAAPSELRAAIVNACGTRGACCPNRVQRGKKWVVEGSCAAHAPLVEGILGKFATQTCNVCGTVARFNARAEIRHTCYECKAEWDQDANHCKNLLASGEVVLDKAPPLAPSVSEVESAGSKKIGRWEKRRSRKTVQAPKITKKKD